MRSTKPKYLVEFFDGKSYTTPIAWHCHARYGRPADGKPTPENLAKWVQAYIESLKPNGSNYHISKSLGFMPIPHYARIVLNGSRTIVAEWKSAAFSVI